MKTNIAYNYDLNEGKTKCNFRITEAKHNNKNVFVFYLIIII